MIEAMKQALEATEVLKSLFRQAEARHAGLFPSPNVVCQITVEDLRKGLYAADALRTAIEEAEKQEQCKEHGECFGGKCIYTTTPEAQRQPLTDEQIDDIWNRYCDEMGEASINDAYDIARAIEAAHGIGEKT